MEEQKIDFSKLPEYPRLLAEWNRDKSLQAEFAGEFDIYLSFKVDNPDVRIKSASWLRGK